MNQTFEAPRPNNHDASETIRNKQLNIIISPNELSNNMKTMDFNKTKSGVPSTSVSTESSTMLPSQVARVKLQLMPITTASGSTSCSATGNPRNKTALAPGHSLMDWIRLGSSGVDLTGVEGVNKLVTLKELAKHNSTLDAWIAIRGTVYNVTRYMNFHPGGVTELMKGVGTDATKLFDDVHAWVNYQSILQKCVVGRLHRVESNEVIPNLCSKKSLFAKNSPTVSDKQLDPIPVVLKIRNEWKQTTHSITFSYKPTREQVSPTYRLIFHNSTEFSINIHLFNGIIKSEYEMMSPVQWPPQYRKASDTMEIEFCFAKVKKKLWSTYGSRIIEIQMKNTEKSFRDWQVISNTSLCANINMLVLKTDNYMEIMPVGRYVEAKMDISGIEVSRLYTPVPILFDSNHELSGYKSDYLCLIVKSYNDGTLSPLITTLHPGEYLTLSNCLGSFVIEHFDEYKTIHMLAAGTGITPMLGIIHRTLCRRNVSALNLLNFNREEKDIFYEKQLKKLSLDTRFKVVNILSQAQEPWEGKRGIASEVLLRELVGVACKQACIFSCGPPGFMTTTKRILQDLGWSSSQMHEFIG